MDIASLRAFVAVAENTSFTLAADELHITQPAISKRISALEEELGVLLFDRIGRRISLTEAGEALLPRARRILNEVLDSQHAIANLTDRVEGRLLLGTSHHIGLRRLPDILRRYSRSYPQVDLDIRFMDSEAVCYAIETGKLELGVITLPTSENHRLLSTPIWNDPLRVVVGHHHPLAGAETALDGKALASYPAILTGAETYTRIAIEQALSRIGGHPRVTLSTNYLETIKMLVSVDLGWSVLPQTMIDSDIRPIEIKGFHPSRQLGSLYHRERTLSNAARAFLDMLGEYADA
jgi:DNA-binding transcriptional LysR family regulator